MDELLMLAGQKLEDLILLIASMSTSSVENYSQSNAVKGKKRNLINADKQ